jgi:SAM-dependent methyltransferase
VITDQAPLEEFLGVCAAEGVDAELVGRIANLTITHLKGTEMSREDTLATQELERLWYASLDRKVPDFSIYEHDAYLGELWACWRVYSRAHLKNLQKPTSLPSGHSIVEDLGRVRSVADLGCGFGYTTAAWREIFPDAAVFGTNLADTVQMRLAQRIGKQRGFKMTASLEKISPKPVDLVFASEYFEHIPEPLTHLDEVLTTLKPRALLIANSFGAQAVGHFRHYWVAEQWVDAATTSRKFNSMLRFAGYEKVETKLWNSRPTYWKLRA